MASQGRNAPLPSALEPLADGTRRHAERGSARRLFPALLFELPGASPPPFAPVESGGARTHAASVPYVYQSLQTSVVKAPGDIGTASLLSSTLGWSHRDEPWRLATEVRAIAPVE